MERTLVLLKPDAVERKLCGKIITRFEQRDLNIVGLKLMKLTPKQAGEHYAEHVGKPFFDELVAFITSGSLVAMVIEGKNAVQLVRTMNGSTKPFEALPGTIRGDFATVVEQNIIHGSDSVTSAEREIAIFFNEHELCR